MTIQESINHAKEVADEKYKEGFLCYANSGDVENDKKNDECVKCAKEHEQLAEWLVELQQYRAIGTVEECREALEKQGAKKIIFNSEDDREYEDFICPHCKTILQQRRKGATRISIYKFKFCHNCGQKLDWSDTD